MVMPPKCESESEIHHRAWNIFFWEYLDTMTGQNHFSLVTHCFWPRQIYKINNSKNRVPWIKTSVIHFQKSHYLELESHFKPLIVNNKNKLQWRNETISLCVLIGTLTVTVTCNTLNIIILQIHFAWHL